MSKLLLIDDDVELANMLKEFLTQEGFTVTTAHDGLTGEQYVLAGKFDLVILDVMMPGQDGLQTLRNVRQHSDIPVLMLTAKDDNEGRIEGLEGGADDYVQKPCLPRELVARIRAILRRQTSDTPKGNDIVVGQLVVSSERRKVFWVDKPIVFTSTEFSLIEILAKHAGTIVSKEDLSVKALGRPLVKYDRSIDVHLSSIRQKISEVSGGVNVIQTIYRVGYQLVRE
ncbi:response regulator transcription factor [Methylophilus medardicus]|uniref:Response regulator transcription factor n=1 Tax=Methylophilus medardicus TaxID=2588534 RepID=A0A5B8CSZ9_9PROT|nr:response regulator transcription factor [Methylophilus medardicus]QDC44442.1 response regulator transcription factor [Methylophilus medardicus]QDC49449.1 response regulator transcription factor [Methylophilus medardicus]QDC53154.1 response regulator transcription factor [Methylophilus medardicus]